MQPAQFFRRVRRRFVYGGNDGMAGFVRVESDVDEDLYGDTEQRYNILVASLLHTSNMKVSLRLVTCKITYEEFIAKVQKNLA